jgi:hypothetical protein
MSSLFLDLKRTGVAAAVAISLAAVTAPAVAADGFFIPEAAARVEHHSNLDLALDSSTFDGSVEGYLLDLGATAGWRSQRGMLELRPMITFQEYPDRDDLESSNRYLDAKLDYGWVRAHVEGLLRYSHEDTYKSQLPDASFDSFDPATQDSVGSGRVLVSESVERLFVEPNYYYQFSERVAAGVRASYETVDYSIENITDRIDYDNSVVDTYLLWDVGRRTKLETGVYLSKYEAARGLGKTDSKGVRVAMQQQLSPTFTVYGATSLERSESDSPTLRDDESTNLGLNVGFDRRLEVSRVRFEAGRYYRPTGTGTRAKFDQFRLQYNRDLSQRWHAGAAVRLFRNRGESLNGNDRDYGRLNLDLTRDLTPTWYLTGGYQYLVQKYKFDSSQRKDNVFSLTLGYRGLDPR